MKFKKWWASILCALPVAAFATDSIGTISELRVRAYGDSLDGIIVLGTFTPSLGCTNSGFMLFKADPYFAESYATLLAAKASGQRIKFDFSYCLSNGYARGNGYALLD